MNKYLVKLNKGESGETEITSRNDKSAMNMAKRWVKKRDWITFDDTGFPIDKTYYVHINIIRNGQYIDYFDLGINPPEPKCIEEKHNWKMKTNENKRIEQCNKCGIFKTIIWKNNKEYIQYFRPKGEWK
jgi:hypothetical protein